MNLTKAKDYITNRLVNELSDDLYYHGAHHTFAVVKAAGEIAFSEGISKKDYNLLLTAAYYHDSGFLFQYKSNEPLAVQLATKTLPKFGYSTDDIDSINKIILATQSHITPSSLLEEIICDADHYYIGTEDYYKISKTLREELAATGVIYTDIEWLEVQHTYLTTKQHYYTKTAKINRVPKKNQIIQELLSNIQKIKID